MSKMIQIRNVPDAIHRKAKARAAALGMSLSDWLRRELEALVVRPSMDEFLNHLERRGQVGPDDLDIVALIREDRDSR